MTDNKKDAFLIARISTDEKDQLLKIAKKNKQTLSALVREMVRDLVKAFNGKED